MMQSKTNSNSNQQPEQEKVGLQLPGDIPRDIWRDIGKRLESRLDVLRFRSVCRTWRSWLPPPLRFPLRVPPPPGPFGIPDTYSQFIAEVTFYAAANGMVVMFEEVHRGGNFSASALVHTQEVSTKLELPPFNQISNLSFLCNAYHLHGVDDDDGQFLGSDNVLKIAIICSDGAAPINPNYPRLRHLKVVAHLADWKLAVLSLSGGAMNNNWVTGFCDTCFEDIVNYRGRLYAVDLLGRAFVMDYNSLQMTQVAPALPPGPDFELAQRLGSTSLPGEKMKLLHLAVVSEDLYVFIHEPTNSIIRRLYKLSSHRHRHGQWLQADQDLPHQVFIQNLQCNFPIARDLIPIPRNSNSNKNNNGVMKYVVPRFCSWPHFVFVRVAVGFNYNAYDHPSPYRYCDLPPLSYLLTDGEDP